MAAKRMIKLQEDTSTEEKKSWTQSSFYYLETGSSMQGDPHEISRLLLMRDRFFQGLFVLCISLSLLRDLRG